MTSKRAALCAAVLFAACGGGSDTRVATTPAEAEWAGTMEPLPRGGVRVRSPEQGLWQEGAGWRLVEDLRIGALDGAAAETFGSLMSLSLAVDGEGRMFVVDGQARELRVFDASGAHVGSYGRAGGGPGELQSPAIAGWSAGDSLWVADPMNARYTAFSTAGAYLASHPRTVSFTMMPWPGLADAEGRILDVGIGRASEHVLIRLDRGTAVADTFPLPQYDGGQFVLLDDRGRPSRSATIPFAGQLVWRLDPRGYVWSALTDQYRIVQQTLAGDTLLIVEREQRAESVTAQERAAEMEHLQAFIDAGGRVDPSRIPATKPLLHDFTVDDRGYLWVAHARRTADDATTYDVFDTDGRYLGEVPVPAPLNLWAARPVFRDGHVYGFTRGALDEAYLVRMRIEGR